jgi:hypothetical protein
MENDYETISSVPNIFLRNYVAIMSQSTFWIWKFETKVIIVHMYIYILKEHITEIRIV